MRGKNWVMNQQRGWIGVGGRMVGREGGEDGLTNFEIFKDGLLQKTESCGAMKVHKCEATVTTVAPITTEIPYFFAGASKSNYKTVLGSLLVVTKTRQFTIQSGI